MIQFFNINFNNIYKKENSTKFILMGILLLALGVFSLFNKHIGIKIISFAVGFLLIFFAYLNLTNINELKRYAPKEEIRYFIILEIIILISAIVLFLFPEKVQILISSFAGIYISFSKIKKIILNKNNPYYRIRTFDIISILFGLTLISSPLFLSKFIVSILTIFIIIIGTYLISIGNNLKL